MGYYWKDYSNKEKLFELATLSAKRNRLLLDISKTMEISVDSLIKLSSGEIADVVKIDDEIIEIIEKENF